MLHEFLFLGFLKKSTIMWFAFAHHVTWSRFKKQILRLHHPCCKALKKKKKEYEKEYLLNAANKQT